MRPLSAAGPQRITAYIDDTGMAEYGQTPGNRGAYTLQRERDGLTEFVTVSL